MGSGGSVPNKALTTIAHFDTWGKLHTPNRSLQWPQLDSKAVISPMCQFGHPWRVFGFTRLALYIILYCHLWHRAFESLRGSRLHAPQQPRFWSMGEAAASGHSIAARGAERKGRNPAQGSRGLWAPWRLGIRPLVSAIRGLGNPVSP